jgi:D-cysteine desulfhydrase/L-cysteate sulfo-lyase
MTRVTAAAARAVGLEPVLVLSGLEGEEPALQGNYLLDRLLGAEIHHVTGPDRWQVDDTVQAVRQDLVRRGRKPYVLPLGGSTPVGVAAYVAATSELLLQCAAIDMDIDTLVLATGTGSTQAGLEIGSREAGARWRPLGISVSRSRDVAAEKVATLVNETATFLGLGHRIEPSEVAVVDDYIGPGYGEASAGAAEAIRLVARTEGVFLDPVYTGKAMAGLIDLVRRGRFERSATVVFLHTGGTPAIFAHADGLASETGSGR